MRTYEVTKLDDTKVIVAILRHKWSDKYSFVNLTMGHICRCEFNSIEEAISDMELKVREGKIKGYESRDIK